MLRVEQPAHRARNARAQIIGKEVEGGGLRFRRARAPADPTADDGMSAEEPEGDHRDAGDDRPHRPQQGHPQAHEFQDEHGPQHLAPAQASRQMSDPRRTEHADQIHAENQAHGGLAQRIGGRREAVADVVVDRHEASQQHRTFREQPGQARVAEQAVKAPQRRAQVERLMNEAPRRRQISHEQQRGDRAHGPDRTESDAPAEKIGQHAGDQAAAQSPGRIAADVQTHAEPDRLRMNLFAQVRHPHGRQSPERQPQERAQHQKTPPIGCRGGNQYDGCGRP